MKLSCYKLELCSIALLTVAFAVIAGLFEVGVFARKIPVSERVLKIVEEVRPYSASPSGLAAGEGILWLSYPTEKLILGLNQSSGEVVRELRIREVVPVELAYGHGVLWVADALKGRVVGLDPSDGRVLKSLCEELVYPTAITFHHGYLYVYEALTEELLRVDLDGRLVATVKVPRIRGLAASEEGLWLLVPDNVTILLLSWDGHKPLRTYYVPTPAPRGLAWDGRYLWLGDYESFDVLKLDPHAKLWKLVDAKAPSWLLPLYLVLIAPFLLSLLSKRRH